VTTPTLFVHGEADARVRGPTGAGATLAGP